MTASPGRSLEIVTFGCRLNACESEVIRGHARTAGLQDAVIVNTCAVTAEAERQARQAIRRVRRERPGARIIVTGCAAQVDPAGFSGMPEVDRVIGNEEKLRLESFAPGCTDRVAVNDIMSVRETAGHLIGGFEGRARAFVEVQSGCDHRCSFCIIPFGRGPSRSVPVGRVVEQVRALVEAGYREVVLSGVDITDYGKDLPGSPALGQMVRRLLTLVPELPRLRLSSLDPAEVDAGLMRLLAEEERLMPHLHLSLQAGDDLVLKRMKRRHLRRDALEFCECARRLRAGVVFGADLIAGFPTETEPMFENTLSLIADCGLTWLHVFPYSERPGTSAQRMGQVPGAVRRARASALREAGSAAERVFLASRVGTTAEVLVERANAGHSEHYARVSLDRKVAAGKVVRARIAASTDEGLLGTVQP